MRNNEKTKNNELIALRFKEIRENYFHSKLMKDGKKSDHTQEDFGEFLGVDAATIRNYEKGKTPIPEKRLRKLANEYKISMEYLLGESDFHTLKEKQEAVNKEQYDKRIRIPHEIDELVGKLIELYGYEETWDDLTDKKYFTSKYLIPDKYSADVPIPPDALIESFSKTGCAHHPHHYRCIVRKEDGKKKYIQDDRFDEMFSDIESYIKYRIEREFR